jgi:hypothetical protein
MKQKDYEVKIKNIKFSNVPQHFPLLGNAVYPPESGIHIEPDEERSFSPDKPYLEVEFDIPEPVDTKLIACKTDSDFIIFKRENHFKLIIDLKGPPGGQGPTNVEVGVRE